MWAPCGIFCITFHDDCIFVQLVSKCQSSLGLLPRVEVVRLFASKPIGQRSPDVYESVSSWIGVVLVGSVLGTITSLSCLMRSSSTV